MGSMNTWILFMQVFLISAGAVSLATGIKFTVPIILPWLRPPYLHILINGIIIIIAAASRFHQRQSEPPVPSPHLVSVKTPPPAYYAAFSAPPEVRTVVEVPQAAAAAYGGEDRVVELKPVMVNGLEVDMEEEEEETTVADGEAETEDEDAFFNRTLTYDNPPPESFSQEFQLEYVLPVKPTRNIPRRVREAKHETLESTWKKIMEGTSRATPGPPRLSLDLDYMPKSKSFKERTGNENSPPSPTSSGIRQEVSRSQDELNRRVEAFIKKVNGQMRLRRQESLNQYMEMTNNRV